MPDHPSGSASNTLALGLLKRRYCLIPTWRSWLLLLLLAAALGFVGVKTVHPFLAINAPTAGEVLVVEGWVGDSLARRAIAEYERGGYRALYVTGGPLDRGGPLVEYRTFAELGAANIQKMRPDLQGVVAVPAQPVRADRTYASAVALKRWLDQHGETVRKLNLLSGGTHARRSRMLFEMAFGSGTEIGVLAITEYDYDPKRWWTSSAGFRAVTNESIAYLYARIFFRPTEPALP